MVKYLLPLVVILAIASGIGYFIFVSPNNQKVTTSTSLTGASNPVPGDNSLESRVSFLETTVNSLKEQIAKLSPSTSPAKTNTTTSTNTEITDLAKKIDGLTTRVSNLESAGTSQVTSTTKSTQYIPMGNGTSSTAMDWTTVSLPEVTINSADYSGYTNAYLEVQMLVDQGNGTAYARIFNNTDGIFANGSETSTGSNNYVTVTSGAFKLSSGNKVYRLQLKTSTGYAANVQFARIKITY